MKKILSSLIVMAMLVGICASFNMTVFADASNSEITTIPDALSDELQTLENDANEKYNTLLQYWAYDPQFIDDVNANFPTFYGGAYIDAEKNLLFK